MSEELMHSDSFLGADFSDGLTHWKYIKRYRKNGKWRYVYANYDTHKSISTNLNLADRYENEEQKYKKYSDWLYEDYEREKKWGNSRTAKEALNISVDYQTKAFRAKSHKEEYSTKAGADIEKNSVSKLASNKINSGKAFVDKVISSIGKFLNDIDTDIYNAGVNYRNKKRGVK